MSIIITRGYSWGSTELVTNTKLHTLIDSATVDMSAPSAIGGTTPAAGAFTTLTATGLFTLTSGQIKFPAEAVPSADPNTIDDYEEGTWEPSLASGTGTITMNTSYNTLLYTKSGRTVSIQGTAIITSVDTPLGDLTMSGLPFTVLSTTEYSDRGNISIGANTLASAITGYVSAGVVGGGTTLYIREMGLTDDGNDLANHMKAGTNLRVGGHYTAE